MMGDKKHFSVQRGAHKKSLGTTDASKLQTLKKKVKRFTQFKSLIWKKKYICKPLVAPPYVHHWLHLWYKCKLKHSSETVIFNG